MGGVLPEVGGDHNWFHRRGSVLCVEALRLTDRPCAARASTT
jgi:hypothetical protein